MQDYVLSCCSSADLSIEHMKNRNIHYICFHCEIDGKTYLDDMVLSLPPEVLFSKMASGSATKTSQVSVG
ncbi:MAG: DegV family protein, partial [Parasporobacterium sp.]|nr:DegV family protein [Parasporobacterium sp.]